MKTYVLMLSKFFPMNHHKSGQETGFRDSILQGKKIHTIRANYPLWEKRIKEVQKGKAIISLRQWEGKPYRSPQIKIAELNKESGVGLEKFTLPTVGNLGVVLNVYPELDVNDGLNRLDWLNWFEHYERNKPMAFIHFTPFRYGNKEV